MRTLRTKCYIFILQHNDVIVNVFVGDFLKYSPILMSIFWLGNLLTESLIGFIMKLIYINTRSKALVLYQFEWRLNMKVRSIFLKVMIVMVTAMTWSAVTVNSGAVYHM